MSETKTDIKMPVGWLRLDRGVKTLPGDWWWNHGIQQWCVVGRSMPVLDQYIIIRRCRYKVGEEVIVWKPSGYSPEFERGTAIIERVYASDHRGVQQVQLKKTGQSVMDSILTACSSDILAPTFSTLTDRDSAPQMWDESDIIDKIDPTNDPNVAPYLASETLGGALEEAEPTEEPQADHIADADKMVEMPVIKKSLTTPKPKTLYIAGPMRGIAFFNYPMFDRVAKNLREAGNEVISPADEDRKQDGFDPFANPEYSNPDACVFPKEMDFHKTVRRCLDAVLRCDEIVLLPGWENSNGAVAELTLAIWLGKRVRRLDIAGNGGFSWACYWMDLAGLAFKLSDQVEIPAPVVVDEDEDEDILDTAARITRGDRNASYGPPDQDFRRTAGMWSALFAAKLKDGETFEPRDVAMAMILLKCSRESHQRKLDNWVDIAGYARCGSMCN